MEYYAFVESIESRTVERLDEYGSDVEMLLSQRQETNNSNIDVCFSVVEKKYFNTIHKKFGICVSEIKEHRERRKKHINEYIDNRKETGMVYMRCSTHRDECVNLLNRIMPGNWYVINVSDAEGSFPVVVQELASIDAVKTSIQYLSTIRSIDKRMYKRLLEVFSLKHIQVLRYGRGERTPNIKSPTPPPVLTSAVSLRINEDLKDEDCPYGKNQSVIERPYHGVHNGHCQIEYWSYRASISDRVVDEVDEVEHEEHVSQYGEH